jgi:hypothetical protein
LNEQQYTTGIAPQVGKDAALLVATRPLIKNTMPQRIGTKSAIIAATAQW